MKIYIAGANSFIGKNLIEYLINNTSYNLDLTSYRYNQDQIDFNNYDIIIDLIGKAHQDESKTELSEFIDINYGVTKQIFDKFLISKSKVFIYISSVKAVGEKFDEPLTENNLPNPTSFYGISKLMAENYLLNNQLNSEKKIFILRPCMIHGPGNKGNLNILYKFTKYNRFWPLGSYNNNRSFCSIENLCFVILNLIEQDIDSGIYNIADTNPVSTNKIISLISKNNVIIKFPKYFINFFLFFCKLFSIMYFIEIFKKLTNSYLVDNSKILKAIGKNLPIESIDGLKKTIKSFK